MVKNGDFVQIDLTPEKVLAVLRKMPEVTSAKYEDGKFFAQTLSGIAEIKFFFPQRIKKDTA